jgi:hypothetical protein
MVPLSWGQLMGLNIGCLSVLYRRFGYSVRTHDNCEPRTDCHTMLTSGVCAWSPTMGAGGAPR